MGWEFSDVVGFDLGPLLRGQTRIAKLKSAYNSLIIGPRGLIWQTNPYNLLIIEAVTYNPIRLG